MSLLLIAVLIPSAKAQLVLSGYPNATGAEQTVPGLAVLCAFLSVEQVTTLFYREHAWGTWDRLRASPASTADIVIGKVVVRFLIELAQTAVVFTAMLGGMLMAGLGGAFAPVSSFPGWVQSVASFTPAYWVLDALRRLTLDHAALADVLPATGVALAFGAGFAVVAALCFRSSAVKVGTT